MPQWTSAEVSQLVERYSARLTAYASAIVGDADSADDIVQLTWVAVAKGKRVSRAGSPAFSWVLRVCRNIAIDHLRAESRRQHTQEKLYELREVSDAVEESPHPLSEALWEVATSLPPRQRQAVILRIVEGYSVREAAMVMACAEGTVKALLHQGLTRLREVIRAK